MNPERDHAVFEDLLVKRRLETLAIGDAEHLQAHLAGCERCRRFEGALDAGLASLAGLPVVVPSSLSTATRLRARLRATELAEAAMRLRLLAAASALACASGLVTACVLWLGVDWLGRQWGAPLGVLASLFFVVWFVPATLAGLAVVFARYREAG